MTSVWRLFFVPVSALIVSGAVSGGGPEPAPPGPAAPERGASIRFGPQHTLEIPAVLREGLRRPGTAAAMGGGSEQGEPTMGPRPTALLLGDLDADGVPERISGWAAGTGGALFVEPGSPGSGSEDTGELVEIAEAPEFVAIGDFDGDADTDLLLAGRGERRLLFLAGDGTGRLDRPRTVMLDGDVTALATGEIDRADGLPDVLVAVDGRGGPRLLLFASPHGLRDHRAESLPLPEAATDLAFGALDGDRSSDLAIAAGRTLLILHGRDVEAEDDARAPGRAAFEMHRFPDRIVSLAAGDFVLDEAARTDLALLTEGGDLYRLAPSADGRDRFLGAAPHPAAPRRDDGFEARHLTSARVSTRPGDDLILWSDSDRRLLVLAAAARPEVEPAEVAFVDAGRPPVRVAPVPSAASRLNGLAIVEAESGGVTLIEAATTTVFTVNSTLDNPDITPGNGACNTSVLMACTLRAAIMEANALPGADVIQFAIGAGTPTLAPFSALPVITETITINGNSGGASRVQIDGASVIATPDGLRLGSTATSSSGGSLLRDLVIRGFAGYGVRIETDGSALERLSVGTDAMGGGTVAGNAAGGILITGAGATANSIGGSLATRCIVSHNGGAGITIEAGAASNKIGGNFIGLSAVGAALANAGSGMKIQSGAHDNVVGQPTASPGMAPGNVLSANGDAGVEITGTGSFGNLVQGNLIGLAPSGVTGLANAVTGVRIAMAAQSNTIGGTTIAQGNVISGQTNPGSDGVRITGAGTAGNFVRGNLIGTDITGAAALGNAQDGVHIDGGAMTNIIGGQTPTPGTPPGNVISGNVMNGVRILDAGTTNTVVLGNLIGTNVTGAAHLRNGSTGVTIDGAPGNLVGGSAVTARNIISGNVSDGVLIENPGANNNRIWGNFIGTTVTGGAPLGNLGAGVRIVCGGIPNTPPALTGTAIGAEAGVPGAPPGNVISGNTLFGVVIEGEGADKNTVSGNLIGTDAAGTGALGNLQDGVRVHGGADDNRIGGGSVAARNVISGNASSAASDGVEVTPNTTNSTQIEGNFIGTDITGMAALPNGGCGVFVNDGPSGTLVGNLTPTPGTPPGNVISGNDINPTSHGVLITGMGSGDNQVLGNIIGLNAAGTAPLPNRGDGVQISGNATLDRVGSGVPGASNVISGNNLSLASSGVRIADGNDNIVQGNLIGLLASGMGPAGNGAAGVVITSATAAGAEGNRIGGTASGERNVISGNGLQGVLINTSTTGHNFVQGNFIGTDVTGAGAQGNGSYGVLVTGGSDFNVIGGTTGATAGDCTGGCNLIAYNLDAGVFIGNGTCTSPGAGCSVNNEIRGNRIHDNAALGIDLMPAGPDLNDIGTLDGDFGANNRQNYPDIISASSIAGTITVGGSLSSSFATSFIIDIYGNTTVDPSNFGEGATWLGSTTCVTTGGSGTCLWNATLPGDAAYLTATATIDSPLPADTSEFSLRFGNPGEVPMLLLAPGAPGSLVATYTPACGASGHVLYMTTGPLGPGTFWSEQFCAPGASGTLIFTPPPLAIGQVQHFVMVGQNSSVEGSYGTDSSGTERPEAGPFGTFCDRPQALGVSCP
ncbi:MAG TPA: hypothetical protein VFD06_13565 [Candidatus Polarisedimenticolia bacterium]|nr:hypothetical protein [Candidatus Polarisedimenticolia bacterium]